MEQGHDASLEDLCPVCGDKVSGYHYGLLTCESCKGFFKRTVQNNKRYVCAENQECRIDKAQRKRCPFCRFQKCLYVGMRLEAVRADRMRGGRNKFGPMYKRDRALKLQRKALIQVSGLRTDDGSPLAASTHQADLMLTVGLHPVPVLRSIHLPAAQSLSLQPPSLCSLLPSCSPWAPQHPGPSTFSNSAIKSENVRNRGSVPGSDAGMGSDKPGPRTPRLVMEFMRCDPDELQLQNKISAHLLQEQTGGDKHGSPCSFGPMFLMADQTLFSIVEWARNSVLFKQLKVSDQMKLLHGCWSDLLLLDLLSRQVLHGSEGRLLLVTGQEMDLPEVASTGPTLGSLILRGQELVQRFKILKVDRQEFSCIKFLLLFNPDVQQLEDQRRIEGVQEQVEAALLEYTLCTSCPLPGRFAHLLLCLSELQSLGALAEDYLHETHLSHEVPRNSLLNEMLHAKHSWP